MVYLVLDLDLTTFVRIPDELDLVDQFHELSNEIQLGGYCQELPFSHTTIQIINPVELSNLIETAYNQYDGVIILTSGAWPLSIRNMLADHLDLTDETAEKLSNCRFHNYKTDQHYFNNNSLETYNALKSVRLARIIGNTPELTNCHFVVLDDRTDHIESLQRFRRIEPIHATTYQASKAYYDVAAEALEKCKQSKAIEKSLLAEKTTRSLTSYSIFMKKRRRDEEGEYTRVSEFFKQTTTVKKIRLTASCGQ